MKKGILIFLVGLFTFSSFAQSDWDKIIDDKLVSVLFTHKELVGIPNLPRDIESMYKNISWVRKRYKKLGFEFQTLASSTLPVLFAEKKVDQKLKTVLFYFHLDGQPVNPDAWDQEDPFNPELKAWSPKGEVVSVEPKCPEASSTVRVGFRCTPSVQTSTTASTRPRPLSVASV